MYKLNNEANIWERDMFVKSKQVEEYAPYDIYHLYTELEKTAHKYLIENSMERGATYIIPFKDGSHLEFAFYMNGTAVTRVNVDGTEDKMLLRKDRPEAEQRILKILSNTYYNAKSGIGEPYPEQVEKALRDAKVGDIITFSDSGKMYVCSWTEKTNSFKTFQQLHMEKFSGKLEDFKTFNTVNINLNDKWGIQKFYDENKNTLSSRMECRVFCDKLSQDWVNHIAMTTEIGESTAVDFAGIHLIAQKAEDKVLRWYDASNSQVSEEKVKLLYAYLKTAPVERKIRRQKTVDRLYDNTLIYNKIKDYYSDADFKGAYDYIMEECGKNGHGFMYQERSVVQDSETKFSPKSFAFFQKKDGEVAVTEVEYEDNDPDKPVKSIKKSSLKEFMMYCDKKYDARYHMIRNKTEEELRKNYPKQNANDKNTDFFDMYVGKKAMEGMMDSLKKDPIIAEKEMKEIDKKLFDLISNNHDEEQTETIDGMIEELGLDLS